MIGDSNRIYFIGGLTSFLAGFLMLFISVMFLIKGASLDVIHGVSVVIPILIVPTVIAITVLLMKDVKTGALLGVGFASLWVVIELIAHGSQTAPLKAISNELIQNSAAEEIGNNFLAVWKELGNALMKIGAFLFTLAAFCYGISLRSWGNPASAYLLIIAALTFPITFIPVVDFYWHVLVRGIAFLFLGGVLMLATRQRVGEEWESN